jgi:hypothetical protein
MSESEVKLWTPDLNAEVAPQDSFDPLKTNPI